MAKRNNPARGIRMHGLTYELNTQRGGVRQYVNLETSDFSEAIKRAEKIREQPILEPSASLTSELDRFIAYKLRMHEYTPHTALTKRNKLLLMVASLPEHTTAATASTHHIQKWHDSLVTEGRESSTIHGYMMSARAFFKWAIKVAKLRRTQPLDSVKIIKLKGRARDSFCTYDQRDMLIRDCADQELKYILYCGFHAGFRFNEIVESIPTWFDLEGKRITMRKTGTIDFKDGEERTVPLTVEFHRFLKSFGLRQPYMIAPDAVKGKWLYRYDFRAKFMGYVTAKGLPWVTPHTMRHTFASLLVTAGESIYKVATWLGDEVATVQKHYGHLGPDEGGIEKAFSQRHKKKKVSSPKPPKPRPGIPRARAGRKRPPAPPHQSASSGAV